jgi:hypothetical protein
MGKKTTYKTVKEINILWIIFAEAEIIKCLVA